jgi:hypothetical protein
LSFTIFQRSNANLSLHHSKSKKYTWKLICAQRPPLYDDCLYFDRINELSNSPGKEVSRAKYG